MLDLIMPSYNPKFSGGDRCFFQAIARGTGGLLFLYIKHMLLSEVIWATPRTDMIPFYSNKMPKQTRQVL